MCQDFRIAIAETVKREARPVEKYGHQPRLYALTLEIGRHLIYDDDVVYAAAWLHDIGVFVGNRPEDPDELRRWDHVKYACDRVPEILNGIAFPQAKISAVLDAIRTHQPHDEPRTLEATILRDADMLEQLGAIGILRAVSKIGRDTRYARFSDVIPVLNKALDELPFKLRLPRARELAAAKISVLASFLESTSAEAETALF